MSHAATFHALHAGPDILVLPNAWDAASAALMADAGAKAVATSSAAVAWAHGYADGDVLPVPTLIRALEEIARILPVPLTADIEGGYSDDPGTVADTVRAVIGAGAVGINLEDGRRAPDLHARKIEAVREAATKAGVDLFINARTDVYLAQLVAPDLAEAEAIRRARLYAGAGASGIFIPFANEAALIGRLAAAAPLPLNIMSFAGVPTAAQLQTLGVRRLSSATGLFKAAFAALQSATQAYLASGDPGPLAAAGTGAPNFNARFG
ncbi:isocitrate lyase/PEP mutase family protein [Phenylobacterium aquaticum]|uniref:isocitrate lyase/PEP mutase family protein n=1 Tax=Phenylobacterium aquaticum TaxID=1763816 RepID=UPI001F5CB340|nr:isocitrate lyase/phosphoenolpyruvate mutase family protein [Phenylobacterium aquaticum]MCI3134050.1 isocitrate lyase/phosphoenolpyruvate mutase family protein [Phenylobacterium aquaticum]